MGGYTAFPLASSFFKKRFRSRNVGLSSTSLRCGSQLSCSVSISSFSSSFCSSVSFAIHASLSNFAAAVAPSLGLGAPKNDVILPLSFVFFAASVAAVAALRLRLIFAGTMVARRSIERRGV
jgi:hypothetical protein